MSRQELADLVNAHIAGTDHRQATLDANHIGKLERGQHRWPNPLRRAAFRAVLGAQDDAEIGFYIIRGYPPATGGDDLGTADIHHAPASTLVRVKAPSAQLGRSSGWSDTSILSLAASTPPPDPDHGATRELLAPAGRYFDGVALTAQVHQLRDEGGVLTVKDRRGADPLPPRSRRTLVVGRLAGDPPLAYAVARHAGRPNGPVPGRIVVPRAYLLDELTTGILWAVANMDEALLNDDTALAAAQPRVARYEAVPQSSAGPEVTGELSRVSQMWLGSDFCARHILRHLEDIASVPIFWTREQRGEEASAWLFFRHKYQYLQLVSARFGNATLNRQFCIPPDLVTASPLAERILLLLAAALMESFRIRVGVLTDPDYLSVEGFVLDGKHQAIVANWINSDRIWHVGVTAGRPAVRGLSEVAQHAAVNSLLANPSPGHRLRRLADYLDLDWPRLLRRCGELDDQGWGGVAQPRSRLLSLAGADRACRYLARVGGH